MIDTLLRALDLRTGRFTSPHLERINERICVDGEPLTDEEFVRAFNDVAPYTHLVDAPSPTRCSFFETIVGMAYAAFADAPVDVAIVEVGLGGVWDATNVADAQVAVVTPIAVDHAATSGDYPRRDRIREGRDHQAGRDRGARRAAAGPAEVLLRAVRGGRRDRRCARAWSSASSHVCPPSGPVLRLGAAGEYDDVFLPLYGAHQAQNAALRWPRSRRSPATSPSTPSWCARR